MKENFFSKCSVGDVSSGKSTLIDRLCQRAKSHPIGAKFPLSGCSLEYRFIDVQDEDTDGTERERERERVMWESKRQ